MTSATRLRGRIRSHLSLDWIRPSKGAGPFLVLIAFWAFWFVGGFRYTLLYYETSRLAYVFNSDGPREVERSLDLYRQGTFYAEDFVYGNVPNFLVQCVLWLFPDSLGEPDFQFVAAVFFVVQYVVFFILMWTAFDVALKLTHRRWFSTLAVLALIGIPKVFYWGWELHPDVFQLAFTTASLSALLGQRRLRHFSSAVWLGLAIGSKYLALIYTLPLIVAALQNPSRRVAPLSLRSSSRLVAVGLTVFLTFGLTNWTHLLNTASALGTLIDTGREMSVGDGYIAKENPMLWIPIFWTQLQHLVPLLLVVGVLTVLLWRRIGANLRAPENRAQLFFLVTLLLVLVAALLHLFLGVNHRVPRYMFHLLPAGYVLLMATVGHLAQLRSKFMKFGGVSGNERTRSLSEFGVRYSPILVFLLLAGPTLPLTVNNSVNLYQAPRALKNSEMVALGNAMSQYCRTEAAVFLPMYSYVPEVFSNVLSGNRYTVSKGELDEADLLVFNSSMPGRYAWPDASGHLLPGSVLGSDKYFQRLADRVYGGTEFELVIHSSSVALFQRTQSQPCDAQQIRSALNGVVHGEIPFSRGP